MSIAYGVTSTSTVIPLLLDASGNVIVSASQLTTTGGKLRVDANGNLYVIPTIAPETTYDSVFTTITNTTLPAGSSNQTDTAVPTSQAYILKNIAAVYTGTVAGVKLRFGVLRSAAFYQAQNVETVVSGQTYGFLVDIPMVAGDQAGVRVLGATLNDDISIWFMYRRIQ